MKYQRICPTCGVQFVGTDHIRKVYCSVPCHKHRNKDPERAVEGFWAKVDKSGPCWIFTGAKLRSGYGHIVRMGIHYQAHRYAWLITNGEIGKFDVLHKCDNPPCCNPAHLYLGTEKDNMRDVRMRGRDRRYFPPEKVREIRGLLGKMKNKEIAKMFNVRPGVISRIAVGKSYRDVQP